MSVQSQSVLGKIKLNYQKFGVQNYKSAAPKTAQEPHLLSLPLSLSVWVSACLRSEAGASVARQCEGRGWGNVHEHQFLSSTNKYKSALPCYNTLQYRNINLQPKGTLDPNNFPRTGSHSAQQVWFSKPEGSLCVTS